MARFVLHLSAACIAGIAVILLIVMYGFFASPGAVRTSPPSVFSKLLVEYMQSER